MLVSILAPREIPTKRHKNPKNVFQVWSVETDANWPWTTEYRDLADFVKRWPRERHDDFSGGLDDGMLRSQGCDQEVNLLLRQRIYTVPADRGESHGQSSSEQSGENRRRRRRVDGARRAGLLGSE